MRILGVDPGLTRCGLGVVEAGPGIQVAMLSVGVARTSPGRDVSVRVHAVSEVVREWLDTWTPDAVAMERVFSQRNLQTVMGVAHISGAVMYLAGNRDVPVTLYTPTEVKSAISGFGGAAKPQVQEMVRRVLGLAETPRPADAADALAIAICHAWRVRTAGGDAVSARETPAQRKWREAERRSLPRR